MLPNYMLQTTLCTAGQQLLAQRNEHDGNACLTTCLPWVLCREAHTGLLMPPCKAQSSGYKATACHPQAWQAALGLCL
jgi:hypothetical protein